MNFITFSFISIYSNIDNEPYQHHAYDSIVPSSSRRGVYFHQLSLYAVPQEVLLEQL
jgi:hypothetical protein